MECKQLCFYRTLAAIGLLMMKVVVQLTYSIRLMCMLLLYYVCLYYCELFVMLYKVAQTDFL